MKYYPYILVFDSGIGGLSTFFELKKRAPFFKIDFLADTQNFPYGEKKDQFLIENIISILKRAYEKLKPDLIVIACNTASTLVLDEIRVLLDIPIVGFVPPIKGAGILSKKKSIGLLATSATVRRPYIQDLYQKFSSHCQMNIHGSQILAKIAEDRFQEKEISLKLIEKELKYLEIIKNDIDVVALGCTHYSLLIPLFKKIYPEVIWLDPSPSVAIHIINLLSNYKGDLPSVSPQSIFYVTNIKKVEKNFFSIIKKKGFSNIIEL